MPGVESAVLAAHEALAAIKLFVAEREAAQRIDQGADPEDTDPSGSLCVFDAFMEYVRGTVGAAVGGTVGSVNDDGHKRPPAPKSKNTDEMSHLRTLVATLSHEVDTLRRDKAELMTELQQFNDVMQAYRDDNSHIQVYKDRIVELQAVLNGTKKPGDITADIGPPQNPVVPVQAVPNEEQRRKEVANELARLTVMMKERSERHKAENIKLRSDKMLLLGENRLLLDRVKVLETQISALSSSSSTTLRELEKQRVKNAMLATTQGNALRPNKKLQPGETMIAGVVMERDVALWLKDMYESLLNDPDAQQTLQAMRQQTPSAIDRPDSGVSSTPDAERYIDVKAKQERKTPQQRRVVSTPSDGRRSNNFAEHVAKTRRR